MTFITVDFWDTLYTDDADSDRRRKDMRAHLVAQAFDIDQETLRPSLAATASWARQRWYSDHQTKGAEERIAFLEGQLRMPLSPKARKDLAWALEEVGLADPPPIKEESRSFLDSVATRHRIVLISDTGVTPGRVLRQILKNDGIEHLFTGLVFSDEIGASKPSPIAFNAARDLFDGSKQSVGHLGDNVDTDVAGAIAHGVRAIHLAAEPSAKHVGHKHYSWTDSLVEAAAITLRTQA